MSEVKPHKTYEQQIEKLKSRGCIITDNVFCKTILENIGYYRLSAYFLPFKQPDDTYVEGTTFEKIYNIYEFDRKLRNLIFSAIEVIEVSLRASLSYFHAQKYGALGYLNSSNFNEKYNFEKFKNNIDREIENNEKTPFVKHHNENYDGNFPLWVISELFTFGTLSYFYSDLKTADQKDFVNFYYKHLKTQDKKAIDSVNNEDIKSWLRCCTNLRNICAHYGRLYYRVFTAVPRSLNLKKHEKTRFWGAILTVKTLFPPELNSKWNNEIVPTIQTLIDEYSNYINLYHMAFPSDWLEQLKK